MKNRNVPILLLSVVLAWPAALHAQATNGTFTVTHEGMAAGGGRAGSGNPMSAFLAIGDPLTGVTANSSLTIWSGSATGPQTPKGGTRTVTIAGTLDDPAASVVVNGVQATVNQAGQPTFSAAGVLLIEGTNAITVTATDAAGNRASQSITVYLKTVPPARPTIAATPAVTTATTFTLTGTKTPGTSVWINGAQAVPIDNLTTWSAAVTLQEGDNVLVMTTKDGAGNQSATNTVTIVVDNLPPVITATPPAKTNFTPLLLSGTVDDSLTGVVVNGLVAACAGRAFEAQIPLIEGLNTLTITATSPNGFVSTKTLTVVLGTIPTIVATQPADGAKLYAAAGLTISATATDKENDPMEFQIVLDDLIVSDWTAGATYPWTPGVAALGPHTVEIRVRDGFGGVASKQAGVYVLRKPVSPP